VPETATHDLQDAFAVLLEDTLRRCERVEAQLASVALRYGGRLEDRPYRSFIAALELVTQGARTRIREIQDEFRTYTSKEGSYHDLAAVAASLDGEVERHVPPLWTDRADELDVFSVSFTRVAKALVPNVEPMLFSWYFDGFRTDVYDNDAARGFEAAAATNLRREFGADFRFVKLWHPANRARDIFHHAVFAHELGHVAIELAAPDDLVEHKPDGDNNPPEDKDNEDAALTWSNVASDAVQMPDHLGSGEREQLLDWFVELACDIFAVRLIGPAFAIAYAEVTAPNRQLEPKSKTASHPPAPLRFRYLRQELDRFTFAPINNAVDDVVKRYMSSFPRNANAEAELAGSEQWLEQTLGRFADNLPRLLGSQEFQPAQFTRDLPVVVALAARGVPPAERLLAVADDVNEEELRWSEPIDWRSILNGVYFWHLTREDFPAADLGADLTAAQQRSERRDGAIQLAQAAVELSEFHRRARWLQDEYQHMRPLDLELARPGGAT